MYDIGYGTCEESEFAQFFFHKILTKKELADYVHKATLNALRYAIKHRSAFTWGIGEGSNFQELYERVKVELINVGFKPLEYDGKWSCFGWSSICINNWKRYTTLENKLLRKSIPKDLRQKVLEISRKALTH